MDNAGKSTMTIWKWMPRKVSLAGIMAWIVFGFLFLPSLIIIPLSFGNKDQIVFPPTEFNWELYRLFFTTSNWLEATAQSGKVALLSTAIALVLGTLAAYGLERTQMRGKQLLLVVLLSPLLIPGVVMALGLYSYFAVIGLAGSTVALIAGHTVFLCPFVIVTVSAGVRELDSHVEIAASVMGASRWKIFASVVLPQLRPSLLTAALFSFLMSFDELVISWFISSPQTMTLPVKMYSSVQTETSPILAAVSTMLTVLSVVICLAAESVKRLMKRPTTNPL
ncbi:ABC transporter permease [Agaricicola taiwanensis]|nr:ABC transporter permease [Agaricicola taiwanensis]